MPPAEPMRDPDLLRQLAEETTHRLRGRNATKADLVFCRWRGMPVVVKDYSRQRWWIRLTLGGWMLRREARAYLAVAGLPGLPRFHGRLGRWALVFERIEGSALRDLPRDAVPEACFDRAGAILDALHRRGVALADLHRGDVLLTADGDVFLVDLATAWVAGPGASWWRRAVFERFCRLDRLALARMRARFSGGDEEEAAQAAAGSFVRWHRRGRALKRVFRRIRGERPAASE